MRSQLIVAFVLMLCPSLLRSQVPDENQQKKVEKSTKVDSLQQQEIVVAGSKDKKASTPTDSLQIRTTQASVKTNLDTRPGEELELGAISIKAVIEKPNVDIIPKRVKPDFEEMRFVERSFSTELKKVSKDLLVPNGKLYKPQKLDVLKKILEKTKEKRDDELEEKK